MYQGLKTVKILSSTLTQLAGVTRDLINYGNYNLYAIDCSDKPSAKYILLNGRFFTPNIVIMGAMNLTKSISIPIGSYGNNWEANIMLFAFFAAIKMAVDIDGDGHFSFIDAFKYMTYVINECCLEIEKIQRLPVVNTIREYELFIETLKGKLDTDMTQEEKQKKEEMEKTLQMDYIHQEPWILNAESAIYTDICL